MKNRTFQWSQLGDVNKGRPNLGALTHVNVYRLLQFSLRHVITAQYGDETCNQLLFEAGKLSGKEFCNHNLNKNLSFFDFIPHLQHSLKNCGIGILRIEDSDQLKFKLTLTIEEDLDCSGTPEIGKTLCHYDEGFLAGIFECYSGIAIIAKELECWGTGSQICRFEISQKDE